MVMAMAKGACDVCANVSHAQLCAQRIPIAAHMRPLVEPRIRPPDKRCRDTHTHIQRKQIRAAGQKSNDKHFHVSARAHFAQNAHTMNFQCRRIWQTIIYIFGINLRTLQRTQQTRSHPPTAHRTPSATAYRWVCDVRAQCLQARGTHDLRAVGLCERGAHNFHGDAAVLQFCPATGASCKTNTCRALLLLFGAV